MYGGYERGILGWPRKEEGKSEEQIEQLDAFEGWIHHWASNFDLLAFVDIGETHVRVRIQESGKIALIHVSDIINGVTDPRKTVVGLSGRVDLT